MSKINRILVLITVSLIIGGCTLSTETPTPAASVQPTFQLKPTETPEISTPTQTPAPATPTSVPGVKLSETDQIVLTIPNPQVFSGREGDPRPDWLGWGAETFAVAPDGSFWIADTAVTPNRLLHYSLEGKLQQEISLENRVVFAYYLQVTHDSLWVLDISAQTPRVVQLSTDGKFLFEIDIPQEIVRREIGQFGANAIFGLTIGEKGELLLDGNSGYYTLLDASGKIIGQPLDELTYYGHTYHFDPSNLLKPILVDGAPFKISPDFLFIRAPFIGFNPDGSFAIAGSVKGADDQMDYQVKYYKATGELLGTARQRPQTFYKDFHHTLSFGPDGSIYQLLSNPDHSVQILRLGFTADLPPITVIPSATPTPLTALQPFKSPATDKERAQNALLTFFANLSVGNYAEAASHFSRQDSDPAPTQAPGESLDEYWKNLCGSTACYPVAEITEVKQVSASEFIFYVVFITSGGTRFEIGACCGGDPALTLPVWQFAYPVQKIDGVWKVMRAPVYTP